MTATEEVNQKQNRRKRRFTLPFTILGLVWGIASFVFAITLFGKEEPSWRMYVIFMPVYLDLQLIKLIDVLSGNKFLNLLDHIFYGLDVLVSILLIIPIGILLGWLIGIAIDRLIAFFKPIGNDDD